MKIAPEEGGDELFKTIFEGISMAKGVHTLDDFDAFMKYKLKGGEWKEELTDWSFNKRVRFCFYS